MNPRPAKKRKANDGRAIDDRGIVAKKVPFPQKKKSAFEQAALSIFSWLDGLFGTAELTTPWALNQAYASRQRQAASDLYDRPVGTVVVMGARVDGQVQALHDDNDLFPPSLLSNLPKNKFIQIAAGGLHLAALSDDGRVFTWGNGEEKALARGGDPVEPAEVIGFFDGVDVEDGQIVSVTAGINHTAFLTFNGNVYVSGAYKDEKDKAWFCSGVGTAPLHIPLPQKVRAIFSGENFTAAILADGSLVTWGMGMCGQLARTTFVRERGTNNVFDTSGIEGLDDPEIVRKTFLTPKPVMFDSPHPMHVVTVACGGTHILVVARELGSSINRVYSSGFNSNGQLGLGSALPHEVQKLTVIPFFDDKHICRVATGTSFSLALDVHGVCLYSFGAGKEGQLGRLLDDKTKENGFDPSPGLVAFPGSQVVRINDIWAGGEVGMATAYNGDLYTWGSGTGPTGHADEKEHGFARPQKLSFNLGPGRPVVHQVSGGEKHVGMIVSLGEDAMDI